MAIFRNRAGLVCLALLAAIPAVFFWPMDALTARDDGGQIVFRAAMPPGSGFATHYIHSVELSPVEDTYFVQDGLILQWRARIKSHNAGMPILVLERGRVYMEPPWIVFEGAVASFTTYSLRVGDETLGQNHLRIGHGPWLPLYRHFPGKRLHLAASRCAIYQLWPQGTDPI
jgi:hypothetical protein